MRKLVSDKVQSAHSEYLKIGLELKQLTVKAIAAKFDINHLAVTSIRRLDDDDLRLIRELIKERERLLLRRAELRVCLA